MITRFLQRTVALCPLLLTARTAWADPQPDLVWNYVGRPGRSVTVKLPPPYKTCDDKDELKVTGTLANVAVYSSTASDAAGRTADRSAQCTPPAPAASKKATLTVVGPSLRKSDVKEFAFDWSQSPNELSVHLELVARVDDEIMRSTRLGVQGMSGSAQFTRIDPQTGLPRFVFSGLPADAMPNGGQLHLAPAGDDLRDPKTGELWDEALDAEPRWLVVPETHSAAFAKPQAGLPSETVRTELPDNPLNRFLAPGPVECVAGKNDCTLSRSGDHWFIDTDAATLPNLTRNLELPVSVTLRQSVGRSLKPATLAVKVIVVECVYELVQLTRVEAGRNQMTSLFQIHRVRGNGPECKEDEWDASLRKAGGTDVAASGRMQVDRNLAIVTWASLPTVTPNTAQNYVLELKYRSGQQVALTVTPQVLVDPAITPTDNLRVYTSLNGSVMSTPSGDLLDISGRKSLAMNRENRVDVGALTPATGWTVTRIGASSYFPTCDGHDGPLAPSFCVKPLQQTDETLKLRAKQSASPSAVALPGAEALVPGYAPASLDLGYIDVATSFNVRPHRVALDLEKHLEVVCGARVIDGDTGGVPRSVRYTAFDECRLVFHPRDAGPDAKAVLRNADQQLIEVSAGTVPTDGTAPKLAVLGRFRLDAKQGLASCGEGQPNKCLSFKLPMRRAAGGEAADYTMVQIEAKHVADQYDTTIQESQDQKTFVVRVRRQPEWLAGRFSADGGGGARFFFTFTVAPLTLFRAPHSGRNVWKSSDAAKLEAANFGAGMLAVAEFWNFDTNSAPWPFLTPQLQLGVLSTVPTAQQLDYPVISFVGGLALRTGVDTAPDAKVEAAAKLVAWGEWLHTFGQRRVDPSWNLLFGFAVDIGSFGN